jgi:murein DD-endopeptidase MepM/ murein hydrolase activator NlpD
VRGKRLALLAGGLGAFLVAGLVVVVVVVVAVVVVFGGGGGDEGAPVAERGCERQAPAVPVLDSGPRVAALTAEQTGHARTIVQVAASLSAREGLGPDATRRAAVIGIMTALQESTLRNLDYGDRDSLGLFQQRAAWASAGERTTPSASATMFYTGGHAGQRGLFDIRGWQSMALWQAAQAVQVSAFPTAYARWERTARATVAALLGGGTDPFPGTAAASPAANGGLDLGPAACDDRPGAAGGDASPVTAAQAWSSPLPAGSFTSTSPFGWRVHPILRDWRLHTGQDLGAAQGTPVTAVAAGRVVTAGPNGGYGNVVIVQHDGGVQSYYAHLSQIVVPAGARVRSGQLVGRVGSTGLSTAPHLHLEIRRSGQPIDPAAFLRARGVSLTRTPA